LTGENGVPILYVGGGFTSAGGQFSRGIARWDGAKWIPIPGLSGGVLGLAIFDDGTGPALYVCGNFQTADGLVANDVAKWDGESWSTLGQGVTDLNGIAWSLATFDDGTGPALYMGGEFVEVDGKPISALAKWNGQQWSQVGDPPFVFVQSLKTRSDGERTALYAAGGYAVAKWDGAKWTRFEPIAGLPLDMEFYDSGTGPQLHVGGGYAELNTKIVRFNGGFACGDFNGDGVTDQLDLGILLAAYDCVGLDCQADADGDGDVDQSDLGILLAHFGQTCG